jgi:hypothetical protein
MIGCKYLRNHKTLEPEPNPKFRGPVGRRIAARFLRGVGDASVDVFWNAIQASEGPQESNNLR